jgi:hypothetical protein
MTVSKLNSTANYIGLSTDTKPRTEAGATFYETDTKLAYTSNVEGVWELSILRPEDARLGRAAGVFSNQSGVHKFGTNPAVGANSTEDIWFGGGAYTGWLTTADEVRVKAGGDSDDAAAGTGAQKVVVEGLDENWAIASEELTMNANGTLASASSSTTFIRVYRAYISDVGTYGGANTGDVIIETDTSTSVVASIAADKGQSQLSMYTVPAGKTAYLTSFESTVDAAKAADVEMFQRQNADDATTPFTGKRLVSGFLQLIGPDTRTFTHYPSFPAKTDIWAQATTGSGAAPAVSVDYDLILVDNE